jgi:hypothetical protein
MTWSGQNDWQQGEQTRRVSVPQSYPPPPPAPPGYPGSEQQGYGAAGQQMPAYGAPQQPGYGTAGQGGYGAGYGDTQAYAAQPSQFGGTGSQSQQQAPQSYPGPGPVSVPQSYMGPGPVSAQPGYPGQPYQFPGQPGGAAPQGYPSPGSANASPGYMPGQPYHASGNAPRDSAGYGPAFGRSRSRSSVPRLRLINLVPAKYRQNVSLGMRYFHAGLYAFCGLIALIANIALGFSATGVLASLAMIGYAAYIGLTRRRYWVSIYMYIIPFLLVLVVLLAH